jgi:hypothetical protein
MRIAMEMTEYIDISDIQATVLRQADTYVTEAQEVDAILARLDEGIPQLARKLEALVQRVRTPAAA